LTDIYLLIDEFLFTLMCSLEPEQDANTHSSLCMSRCNFRTCTVWTIYYTHYSCI